MKKLLVIAMLLGISNVVKAQELFVSATNKGLDGYITGGYIKNGWGVFAGTKYNDGQIINAKTGSLSDQMKYGIIRVIKEDKMLLGVGIQPVGNSNKINAFIGYNPLKSKEMKLWVIGNLVGNEFAPGLGLSYKLK